MSLDESVRLRIWVGIWNMSLKTENKYLKIENVFEWCTKRILRMRGKLYCLFGGFRGWKKMLSEMGQSNSLKKRERDKLGSVWFEGSS